jgi:asparagine synthase (glutamine-hydrolysing)
MARVSFYSLPRPIQQFLRKRERLGASLIASDLRREAATLPSPDRGSSDFKALTLKSITHGLYELLHYEDRNAMHFGIESRVPFLDHRLVEWAVGLPANEKITDGWTKYPVRRYLDARGLKELAWRKDKLGFVAPQQRWREALLPELRSRALDGPTPDWLDRPALEALFNKDLQSNAHLSEFWRVTALMRWVEAFRVEVV